MSETVVYIKKTSSKTTATKPGTVKTSDHTPALALPKQLAGIFDKNENDKGSNKQEAAGSQYHHTMSLLIYITLFYPTIHFVFVILYT